MNSEKLTQIVLGGFMIVAIISIGWFLIESNKQAAIEEALRKQQSGAGEAAKQSAKPTSKNDDRAINITYSVDNASDPYKTLSLGEVPAKLRQSGEQVFYIGCRQCGHCLNLEKIIKQFLDKYKDKNSGRDLIYKIEAGFSCVPSTKAADFKHYEQIYQFLVDSGVAEENSQKSFGTPQFYLIKDGKIADSLDRYGRSISGLEKMFTENKYRGF